MKAVLDRVPRALCLLFLGLPIPPQRHRKKMCFFLLEIPTNGSSVFLQLLLRLPHSPGSETHNIIFSSAKRAGGLHT